MQRIQKPGAARRIETVIQPDSSRHRQPASKPRRAALARWQAGVQVHCGMRAAGLLLQMQQIALLAVPPSLSFGCQHRQEHAAKAEEDDADCLEIS